MAASQRTSSPCSDPILVVDGDRLVSIAHIYPEAIEMVNDTLKTILVTAVYMSTSCPSWQSARNGVSSDRRSCKPLGRASAVRSQVPASK